MFICRVLIALLCVLPAVAGTPLNRPWTKTGLPDGHIGTAIVSSSRYVSWMTTEGGAILRSEDGGITWNTVVQSVGTGSLNAITFHPFYGVIAVGSGGTVVGITANDSTFQFTLDAELELRGITVTSTGKIVMVGSKDVSTPVILVADGIEGEIVEATCPAEGRVILNGVRYLNGMVCAYGTQLTDEATGTPLILTSGTEGRTWTVSLADEMREFSISAVANIGVHMIAVGYNLSDVTEGGLYRSTDGGDTWSYERHDALSLTSDMVRAGGSEFIAVGLRFIAEGEERIAVMCEYVSSDAGHNWGIRDLPEAGGGPLKLAVAQDKVVMCGFDDNVFTRWYDRTPHDRAVVTRLRHVECGMIPVGTKTTLQVDDIAMNTTSKALQVTRIVSAEDNGLTVVSPKVADHLEVMAPQHLSFEWTPAETGTAWNAITIEYSDGSLVDVYVSATAVNEEQMQNKVYPQDMVGFGEVNVTTPVSQSVELLLNGGDTAITVHRVSILAEDAAAFEVEVHKNLPVTIQPGQSLLSDVYFMPYSKGIYRTEILLETSVGTFAIPVSASSRTEELNDIIDLGVTTPGLNATGFTNFYHALDNEYYTIQSIASPSHLFAIETIEPTLPQSLLPFRNVTVGFSATPDTEGLYTAMQVVQWNNGDGEKARADRRILRVVAKNATSVSETNGAQNASLWPNPITDVLNVAVPSELYNASIRIVDVFGRVVAEATAQSNIISLSVNELVSGMYIVLSNGKTLGTVVKR